jgi:hypothetical protein
MLAGELPFKAETVQETMIKRLTDEPAKLAATRPDLPFPTGLQEVLDNALARTPVDRYQTVSKFGQDVASITGVGSATVAVPATRANIEGEKTQLLDTSATKAMAAKAKTRSFMPMVGGAVAVLALGGGAWAVFGHKTPPANGGQLPADTTKQVATVPPKDTSKVPHPNNQTRQNNTTNPGNTSTAQHRVDPAKASDALDALLGEIDGNPTGVRDSALILYNASIIANTDRALAAFIIANAFGKLNDKTQYCSWMSRAKTLDGATPSYGTTFAKDCQ